LVREFELLGATYSVAATREQMIYASSCRQENVKDILPLLADATNPQIAIFQIRDALHPVEEHSASLKADPRNYVLDALHQRAFRQQGLGNSLYVTPTIAHHVTSESVSKYHKKFYVPENISVVGVGGVKHDELVKMSEKLFVETGKATAPVASKYSGGETLEVLPTEKTFFGIGYNGVAASNTLAPAALVLRSILGEVSRYSREPVGNGASGVLGRNILEDHSSIQHLEANSFSYVDGGLFGVYGVAEAAKDHKYASHLVQVLGSLSGSLTEKHLALGKAIAKSQVAFNNSSTLSDTLEFVGTNPEAKAPAAVMQAIDSVSLSELQQAAKQIFASKPTVVAVGALEGFPSLD
jgi:predicted Zn-dependent peptidase